MNNKLLLSISLLVLFFSSAKETTAQTTISTISTDKSEIAVQESFQIKAKISAASAKASYFIKCRVGQNRLDEGQTYNPTSNKWLNDNTSWIEMPQIISDSEGNWEGFITCRVKDTTGQKKVYTRACPNNADSCDNADIFQSNDFATINVLPSSSINPTPTDFVSPTTNSIPTIEITTQALPTLTQEPSISNIYLSEIMVYPEGGENEWVELYNANDYAVSLVDWYIDDVENGGTAPKKFSLDIPAKSWEAFELSPSMFNNDGDWVRLLDSNQQKKDSFQYQQTEKGKTLGRVSTVDNNFCLQIPSKRAINNPCLNSTATNLPKVPTPSPLKKSPTPFKVSPTIDKNSMPTKYQASPQLQTNQSNTQNKEEKGKILGTTIESPTNKHDRIPPLLKTLSFASFSYSILAMITIVLKIKKSS